MTDVKRAKGRNISRRHFIYLVASAGAVATMGVLGYLYLRKDEKPTPSPIPTPTYPSPPSPTPSRPLKADFAYEVSHRTPRVDFDYMASGRTLKYINPTSDEEIVFLNMSTHPDRVPLACSLYIDDRIVSSTTKVFDGEEAPRIYSARLPAGSIGTEHEVRLEVREMERLVNLHGLTQELFDESGDLSYAWFVDGQMVSGDKDYSLRFPVGVHRVGLKVSDGRKEDYTEKAVVVPEGLSSSVEKTVTVDPDQLYPTKKLGNIPLKGVNYDAGIDWDGIRSWRNLTDEKIERELLDVINGELGCNTVRIVGDNDNIFRVANIAIEKGKFDEIAISPRFISETMDNTVTKVADVAKKAEKIREKFDRIVFIVGNELPIDNRGVITNAPTYAQRCDEVGKYIGEPEYQNRLNDFLKKLVTVTSQNFGGKITYSSTWWEQGIRWEELDVDIISSNQFYHPQYNDANQISKSIKKLGQIGKPTYITEFGCCTFEGAFEAGGAGWNPELYGNRKYSQEEQAKAIEWYVNLFNSIGVDGMFLANFIDICEDDRASFGIFRCKYYEPNTANGWTKSKPERKLGCYMYKSFKL